MSEAGNRSPESSFVTTCSWIYFALLKYASLDISSCSHAFGLKNAESTFAPGKHSLQDGNEGLPLALSRGWITLLQSAQCSGWGLGRGGEANAAGNGSAMGCCLSQITLEHEMPLFIRVDFPTSCMSGPELCPLQLLLLSVGSGLRGSVPLGWASSIWLPQFPCKPSH